MGKVPRVPPAREPKAALGVVTVPGRGCSQAQITVWRWGGRQRGEGAHTHNGKEKPGCGEGVTKDPDQGRNSGGKSTSISLV